MASDQSLMTIEMSVAKRIDELDQLKKTLADEMVMNPIKMGKYKDKIESISQMIEVNQTLLKKLTANKTFH